MATDGNSIGLVVRTGEDGDALVDAVMRAIAVPLLAADLRFVTRAVPDLEAELRTYRLWGRVGGVAGVIVIGATDGDERLRVLTQIDMPFAALTRVAENVSYPAVTIDATAASRALVTFLETQGARRRLYVTSQSSPEPFPELIDGIDAPVEVVVTYDVRSESLHRAELASKADPIVMVLDEDEDAVALLDALYERGIPVPDAVSLICWSDSLLCQSARLPITAIDRHGREIGALLGAAALAAIHGVDFGAVLAPQPIVVARETT